MLLIEMRPQGEPGFDHYSPARKSTSHSVFEKAVFVSIHFEVNQ